jgi:hypothetical protein
MEHRNRGEAGLVVTVRVQQVIHMPEFRRARRSTKYKFDT